MTRPGFSKYRAKRTVIDGISFPSRLEASVYAQLKRLEMAGQITNLRSQVPVRLKDKCRECGDGPLDFTVDFSYEENGKTVFVEAKGVRVSSYVRREKAWAKNPPGRLEVWGGNWRRPKLMKVIEP